MVLVQGWVGFVLYDRVLVFELYHSWILVGLQDDNSEQHVAGKVLSVGLGNQKKGPGSHNPLSQLAVTCLRISHSTHLLSARGHPTSTF